MYEFSWLSELWIACRSIFGKGFAEVIATAIFLAGVYGLKKLADNIKWAVLYFGRVNRALGDVKREVTPAGLKREGKGLWMAQPVKMPEMQGIDPMLPQLQTLVVANAKGGVGKTTVAANLAGRFAELAEEQHQKPVLLIDLDFQGSLTSMSIVRGQNCQLDIYQDSLATRLVSGEIKPEDLLRLAEQATYRTNGQITPVSKLKIIPAWYDLAQAENRVMIEWLLGDRNNDIRFWLLRLLQSNTVRETFRLVVIDCPPRLTTGAIQALAAGTHLLVPTILDGPSGEAVLSFVRQVEIYRQAGICPQIRHVGVVPTMVDRQANNAARIRTLRDRLQRRFEDGGGGGVTDFTPESTYIPDSARFTNAAGQGIAYLSMGNGQTTLNVRTAIRALAAYTQEKMSFG